MVRRVINLFYREFQGLHQAAYVLAIFAFASQILALIRDRALAHTFGAGIELDLYYTAFRIPDILFVVFSSMLSVYVLIPFVTKLQNNVNSRTAANLLSQIFTLFLLIYSFIALILFLFSPHIVPHVFSSFTGTEQETLVSLLQILLLQPFFLGLSALLGVVTQLRQRYIIYAISPILYNIGIIFGVFYLYPNLGLNGLVWGVVLGAVAHAAIQVPLVWKSSLRFSFAVPSISSLYDVVKVAIPRALTLSIHQFVLLVLTIFATGMTVGSVSVFQFAYNLQSVPLTIIGVSYSVAAFPVLARLLAEKEFQKFKTQVTDALRHIIFWALPVITLIVILRAQLVRVLLGSGNFGWDDTRLTAAMLAIFIISLLAQAINLLSIRAFYAYGDTRTPLVFSIIGSSITLLAAYLSYAYLYTYNYFEGILISLLRLENVNGIEVVLLAASFTLGVCVQAGLLIFRLRKVFPGIFSGTLRTVKHAVLASLIGGLCTYTVLQLLVYGVRQDTLAGVALQGALAALFGICSMYATYRYTNGTEFQEIKAAITKRYSFHRFLGLRR